MQVRATLLIGFVTFVALEAHAQSVIRSLTGASGQKLGSAIANAGDANGDGWDDYLVGMPNTNGGRGGVTCVSGKYLATGIAPSVLYTYFFPVGSGSSVSFGWSIAALGDVTGDGAIDFAVGAPYYDATIPSSKPDSGAVFFFNGGTHTLAPGLVTGASVGAHLGWSISYAGDMNGDLLGDLIAGAPGAGGEAKLISGAHLAIASPLAVLHTFLPPQVGTQWGESVLGNIDFNGDGAMDLVIAAPYGEQFGHTDQGHLRIFSGGFNYTTLGDYWGADGSEVGRALAGVADFNGDGQPDFVASTFKGDGGSSSPKAVVLSGHQLLLHTPPFELYTLLGPPPFFSSTTLGASLAVTPDLNADGVADILVGMPNYNPTLMSPVGGVRIYSGATGSRIGGIIGSSGEHIGSAVLGAFDDFDADGYPDFLVGGTECDAPTTDCGVIKALRLFPSIPIKYCVGKVNSLGCTPSMTWSGVASASSLSAFTVSAINIINNKNGVLFYGYQPFAVPFQGGVKCVHAPLIRTGMQNSGGSTSGNDCTGTFSFDFTARIQNGIDPQLVAGNEVFCQYWSRDPASASTTSLTDALSFLINP